MLLEVESAWLQVFGRFHIVLLHLPIGLIPAMCVLEFGAAIIRRPPPKGALLTLAVMTALTSAAAFGSGLVLAGEKVQSTTLSLHKNAAIAMAAVSALLPLTSRSKSRWLFRLMLLASLSLSMVTGHYGGTLTHKKNFLFKPLERAQQKHPPTDTGGAALSAGPSATSPDQAHGTTKNPADGQVDDGVAATLSYERDIAPVIARCCTGCHNPDDLDGDLDLTTHQAIMRGWGDEVIITPNKPDESPLIESLTLPDDDEMRMPPIDEEEQLTAKEITTIRAWVLNGCPK